uniref:Protein kinase domain-containing protein n=1 Tax=Physcomitrium patens TaxID=3218 RepID=A0A7I4ACX5_PHYPA
MSDYLQQANDVLKELQNIRVKLNLEQCKFLMAKLADAIKDVNRRVRRADREFDLVLSELYRVTLRVWSLLLDCCYCTQDSCLLSRIIAASQVTDSRQRFLKLHAELKWCLFLISCIVKAPRRPSLGDFNWDKTVDSIANDITFINAANTDWIHLVKLLKESFKELGDHRVACKCMLSRLGERVDSKWELGIPLVTNRTLLEDGQGGQGTIDVVTWKDKVLVEKTFNDLTDGEVFRKEADFLGRFSHPHILSMICSYEQPEGYGHIMMEKFSKDLHAYIRNRKSPLAPLEAAEIILQISEGMHYLHTVQKVAHRGLKPKNVLVKEYPVLVVKVSDFGLAKVTESISARSEQTANCGTTLYRAPEMFAIPGQEPHHECEFISGAKSRNPWCVNANAFKADVYSFAVTCFFILTGEEPYRGHRLGVLYDVVKVRGLRPVLPASCPPILSWLIERCWHPDSSQRPSFSEICEVLRTLKAILLTGGSGFLDKPGVEDLAESGLITLLTPEKYTANKRILVVGRSDSGKENLIDLVCGFRNGSVNDAKSGRWTPDSSMCLLNTGDLESRGQLDFLKNLIMSKNGAWTSKSMKRQWYSALHPWKRVEQEDSLAYSNRIHLLWLVYSVDNSPGPEFTKLKNLCNLPIQIVITQKDEKHDPNGSLYHKNFHAREASSFPKESQVELKKKIVKVNFAHFTQAAQTI